MTIHLPEDVESSIEAAVRGGLFESVNDALSEAWRCLQRQQRMPEAAQTARDPQLGSIGAMRDDAEFLDMIVEDAMKARREQPWWLPAGE